MYKQHTLLTKYFRIATINTCMLVSKVKSSEFRKLGKYLNQEWNVDEKWEKKKNMK